jgi:hypothetical protein
MCATRHSAAAGAPLADLPGTVTPTRPVLFALASLLATGTAHADVESLNPDAFDLSGALDRPLAPSRSAVEVAIGAGYTQGVGGAGSAGSVQDVTGPGGSLELHIGYRVTPQFALGGYATVARFRHGEMFSDGSRVSGATAGVQAVWHARASRSVDPWIGLGAGWRGLWISPKDMTASSVHGVELARLQLGIDYRFSRWFAIAPTIGVSASLFLREGVEMATELSRVRDNRLNLYGFTGVLGRFDIGR